MTLVAWIATLLAGLAVLVKSADLFIGAAERLGLRFGLPPFLVGVTIVALGTSFPELVSSVAGVLMQAPEIAVATAVGSNITNILLILSAAAIAGSGLRVAYELVRVDLPFLFGSALLLTLFAFNGSVSAMEGLLCLSALVVYLVYAGTSGDGARTTVGVAASEVVLEVAAGKAAERSLAVGFGTWAALLGGAVGLQVAAYLTVEAVKQVSAGSGLDGAVIAASVVALGTSLPELSVSVRAARAGKAELAIGNVVGSNIFNALGVVGLASLFGVLSVPPPILGFALPAMLAVTVLCFFVLQEREMTHWDGWLLLVMYVAYTAQLYEAL